MKHEGTSVWITVDWAAELGVGEMRAVATEPPVALYRLDDGYVATADTCTHMYSSLCDGYLDGDVVECVLHMATFSVRSGAALTLPATQALRTFPVREVDGVVSVEVDEDMWRRSSLGEVARAT